MLVTASPQFELQLLGKFGFRCSSRPAELSIASKKARALLAYLAMRQPMRESREHVATLLWPDRTDRMARQNLRACVASIRRDLAELADTVLLADDDMVGLRDGLVVDARRLRRLAEQGDADGLEEAARLYRGPFMSEFDSPGDAFREWVMAERAKLEAAAGMALAELANRADAAGEGVKAVDLCARLTAIDPFREDWLRLSLGISARHLGRDKALLQARSFAALLRKELDVEPEALTAELIEQIKAGRHRPAGARNIHAEDKNEGTAPPPVAGDQMLARWPSVAHGHGRWPTAVATAAAAALCLVAGLSIVHELNIRGASPRTGALDRVVDPSTIPLSMSPFQPQPADADAAALARELSGRVLADVSRFSGLTVFDGPPGSSGRGGPTDRFLETGSVRRQEGGIRISVGLTDAVSRAVVWASDYAVDDTRNADSTGRVSRQIARDLQIAATYALARELDATHLDRAPLNQLIAKALTIQYRSPSAAEEAPAAALYEEVLRRDRDNALALTGLAARLVTSNANMLSGQKSSLAPAEQLLDRALRSDPHLERAHYWRGIVHLARGQYELALQSFERALALNPSFLPAEAHAGYALVLSGRADEGLRRIDNALSESSHDPTERLWLRFAGIAQLELGKNGAAINTLLEAASLAPPVPPLRAALASAYALTGDRGQSRAQFQLMKQTADPAALAHLLARAADNDGRQRSRYLQGLWLAANEAP